MVQKKTGITPLDSCGVWGVQVIHVYTKQRANTGKLGIFLRCSVKSVRPKNWLIKKTKVSGILIHTKKESFKIDGSWYKFKNNNGVLLKKRLQSFGNEILGPVPYELKRHKFINLFAGIL